MGATVIGTGTTFKVWAPHAKAVFLLGQFKLSGSKQSHLNSPNSNNVLMRRRNGLWTGFLPFARDGDEYLFYVVGHEGEGLKRDPYAKEITNSWPNPYCIIRKNHNYTWRKTDFKTHNYHDLIIYQIHVGAFSGEDISEGSSANFLDIINKVHYFNDLGITALQFLPLVEYKTRFSLGYNCVDYFSPENDYVEYDENNLKQFLFIINSIFKEKHLPLLKSIEEIRSGINQLKVLIDICHCFDISIIFDVVYNHAGGDFGDNSLYFFDHQSKLDGSQDNNMSLYFSSAGWAGGLIFAYRKPEVRQFLIDNAVYFVEEYHIDGYRYDEISVLLHHCHSDDKPHVWSFCQELTSTLKAIKPDLIQNAEHWGLDHWITKPVPHGGAGFDMTQNDKLRNAIRNTVKSASYSGEHTVELSNIAKAMNFFDYGFSNAWNLVNCIENHDIVKMDDDDEKQRIPKLANWSNPRDWYARSRSRVALGLLMISPGIPMLFMGQEFLEDKRWKDDIEYHPDLLLYWEGLTINKDMKDYHRFTRDLISIRNNAALKSDQINTFHVNEHSRVMAVHRWAENLSKDIVVVASFNNSTLYDYNLGFPHHGKWKEIFNSDVYEQWLNPDLKGNEGGVYTFDSNRHGFSYAASIVIPANTIIIFSRE